MKRSLLFALLLLWVGTASGSPNLCLLTGNINQIWGLASGTTGANVRINYQGLDQGQNPGGSGGSIIPGNSECNIYTDANGNLPASGYCTSFIQGTILYVTIGSGQPIRIQIPLNSTADLSTLILANEDPPAIVTGVTIAPGGSFVLGVTNPLPGTVGQVVLSPGNVTAFEPAVCPSPSIVVGEGNNNALNCLGGTAVNNNVEAVITNTSTGTGAQAGFFVGNSNGIIGGFSALGTGSTFGAPYNPNEVYLNGDTTAGVLLYAAVTSGALHFAADGQGAVGTLDMTEDSSGDFTFTSPSTANGVTYALDANGAAVVQSYNPNVGAGAYADFQAITAGGTTRVGTLGSGYTPGALYLGNGEGFIDNTSANGLLIKGDAGALHFGANGQAGVGTLNLTEDGGANFFFTYPAIVQFQHSAAGQAGVYNANGTSTGYANFEVLNDVSDDARLGMIGSAYAGGAPYNPHTGWVDSNAAAGLLLYGVGGPLHLAADGEGSVGTLDVTEDGAGNFFFTDSANLQTQFHGGNPTLTAFSTTNSSADIFQVLPQNLTQGVGIYFGGIRSIGSSGTTSLALDSESGGSILLGSVNTTLGIDFYAASFVRNNFHLGVLQDATAAPTLGACGAGSPSLNSASTDNGGIVTVGGAVNSCTINVGRAWHNAPSCQCGSSTAGTICYANGGTGAGGTTVTMSLSGTAQTTGFLNWSCIDH